MAATTEPVPQEPMTVVEDLSAVLPMTAEMRGDRLWIGGVDMTKLAREQGTALYVMDEEHIRRQLREYVKWTTYHWRDCRTIYAGKAFMSVAMCRLVAEEGCSLDVSSGGELAFAIAADFPLDRVYVHGNSKTMLELHEAIKAGVGRIVVDSFEELERVSCIATEMGKMQGILLRITPGIKPDTHGYIQTGQSDSKFGFGMNHGLAMEAVRRALELPCIDLAGLHMHIGSQIFALQSYAKAIEVIVHFMDAIRRETGLVVRELDTGGGLGIAYGLPDEPSTVEQYGKVIVDGIKDHCERDGLPVPTIMVEPGRSIVANAGVTLYTAGTIKEVRGIRTYVAVDGGMTDNIRTALYDAHYEVLVANRADQARSEVVTIAGKHCETGDLIARDVRVQPIEIGDIVCVCSTGAYCQSMASNYNKQVRPAVVFVSGGEARVVVRRETYDDMLRCEIR